MAGVQVAAMVASTAMAMKQVQDQKKAASAAAQRQQQANLMAYEENQRKSENELKRVKAAQRVRAAASGLDNGGGSSAAILKGLQKTYDEEQAFNARKFQMGQGSINDSLQSQLNLAKTGQQSTLLNTGIRGISLIR